MDQRLDRRYLTNLDVTVTEIADQRRITSGQVVDISQSGMCATLSLRLPPGTIVKAQIGDCVLFGLVTYCNESDLFRTGIEIVRVLMGESDLAKLLNSVLAEIMPKTPGVLAHPART